MRYEGVFYVKIKNKNRKNNGKTCSRVSVQAKLIVTCDIWYKTIAVSYFSINIKKTICRFNLIKQ